jgi:hypothetical protein
MDQRQEDVESVQWMRGFFLEMESEYCPLRGIKTRSGMTSSPSNCKRRVRESTPKSPRPGGRALDKNCESLGIIVSDRKMIQSGQAAEPVGKEVDWEKPTRPA